jgi:hypothetical protein
MDVGFDVAAKPTVRAARILGDQFVDDQTTDGVSDAIGDPEVEIAHGVGIGQRRCREGTGPEPDVHDLAALTHLRIEALACHLLHELVDGIPSWSRTRPEATPSTTPHFDWRVSGVDDFAQEQGESLIRASHPPAAVDGGRHEIQKPGSSTSCGRRRLLDDQIGVDQLGQMLADGVVVQTKVRGELGDVDGSARVGDVSEDGVARRVAKCSGLLLERRHVAILAGALSFLPVRVGRGRR